MLFKYCFILLNKIRFLIYIKNFWNRYQDLTVQKIILACFLNLFFCNGCSLLVRVDYFHPFFKATEEILFLFAFFHYLRN